MNFGVFIGSPTEPAEAILKIAVRRSRYFGKHGERFDRALYSELEALIRIWLEFVSTGIMLNSPKRYKKLLKIQRNMLKHARKRQYQNFP